MRCNLLISHLDQNMDGDAVICKGVAANRLRVAMSANASYRTV